MELGWEAKHRGRVHLQDEHLMRWKSRWKAAICLKLTATQEQGSKVDATNGGQV